MAEILREQKYTGERALFASADLKLERCTFADGESPLKESRALTLEGCLFQWKYPLWYCRDVTAEDCVWFKDARAGVWYTENVSVRRCVIDAPKNFRRCRDLTLEDVSFSDAAETLWTCEGVRLKNVTARGDYFGMNSRDLTIENLTLYGNYGFDGAKDVRLKNCKLLTKDAFWNCENVTAENCFISGEYLGWNSKNVTLIGCTVESLQGLCYIDTLVMKNCVLLNTTLAFEYSTVDCETESVIDSIKNPISGRIVCGRAGELIFDDPGIRREDTVIVENQK